MKFSAEMLQVYLIAGTQDVDGDVDDYLARFEMALAAGVTAFQFRDKDGSMLSNDQRWSLAKRCRDLAHQYQVPLIIDDDYQLALAIGADGVHVGQKDQRIDEVLAAVGEQMFVGYSCNTPAQVRHANQLPVAYIGSGPVFATGSKADADPVVGTTKLHDLVKQSVHPVVAVGGITLANTAEIMATGVSGISGISVIMRSADVTETVHQLKETVTGSLK